MIDGNSCVCSMRHAGHWKSLKISMVMGAAGFPKAFPLSRVAPTAIEADRAKAKAANFIPIHYTDLVAVGINGAVRVRMPVAPLVVETAAGRVTIAVAIRIRRSVAEVHSAPTSAAIPISIAIVTAIAFTAVIPAAAAVIPTAATLKGTAAVGPAA